MLLALAVAVPALLVGHGRAPLARCAAAQMAAPESTPRTEMKLTPTLIEWGVDAELWGATRNKQASRTTLGLGLGSVSGSGSGLGLGSELWGAIRNKQVRRPTCTNQAVQSSL